MAIFKGCDGVIYIGSEQVAETSEWSFATRVEVAEVGIQGSCDARVAPLEVQGEGQISAFWDSSDANGQEMLKEGASVTLLLREQGAGSGLPELQVPALVTDVERRSAWGDYNRRDFSFRLNGAYTETPQT